MTSGFEPGLVWLAAIVLAVIAGARLLQERKARTGAVS